LNRKYTSTHDIFAGIFINEPISSFPLIPSS
jgi:hypothetical protein